MQVKLDGETVEFDQVDTDVYAVLQVPADKDLVYLYHSRGGGYVVPRDRAFWILDGDRFNLQDRDPADYRPPPD